MAAVVAFMDSLRSFRDGLDEQDAEQFEAMVRRDYETMLHAEARAAGPSHQAALIKIVERERAAGRSSVSCGLHSVELADTVL